MAWWVFLLVLVVSSSLSSRLEYYRDTPHQYSVLKETKRGHVALLNVTCFAKLVVFPELTHLNDMGADGAKHANDYPGSVFDL